MHRNLVLLAAMILVVALVVGLGRGGPAEAQAQTPERPDAAAQTSPDSESVTAVPAQSPAASELLQEARSEGSIRAIVGLRTDFVPEGRLSGAATADQRDGIDGATAALRSELAGTGSRTLREYETVPYVALELTPEAFREVQDSPRVTTIQEDVAVPAALEESTPIVQAQTMWANPIGSAFRYTGFGRTIAVLDTGVDRNHPFFSGRVVEEACFSGGSDCPNGMTTQTGAGSAAPCTYANFCDHGTHVAGIAAGQGSSFSGVAKGADVMAVQVFSQFTGTDCNDAGEDPCTKAFVSDQLAGLEHVYNQRDRVNDFAAVNMSIAGGTFTSNCDTDSRKPAIDNLRSISAATTVASGNNGFTNAVGAPACISSAITVGSTTKTDSISSFSNASPLVELLAPGDGINSSVPGTGFGVKSGTSMAAPHVAGAYTLLEHWDAGQTVGSLTDRLQQTGLPVTDSRAGGTVTTRRINIADAANQRPPGDFFSSPQSISGPRVSLANFNGAATREFGEPDHWSGGTLGENSVWYSWRAPISGRVTINTCTSSFDTVIAAYAGGSTFPSLTQVASDDDTCTAPNNSGSRTTFTATSGTTYRIAVAGYSSTHPSSGEGTFTLGLAYAPPGNDNFSGPTPIPSTSTSIKSRNAGATREAGEPDHWSGASLGERSVWYSWRAPFSGRVTMDTCSSSYDTVLAAYRGSTLGSLDQVASDDDSCNTPNGSGSRLSFSAVEGTTYRIAVAGYFASSEGTFTLGVLDTGSPRVTSTTPADNAANVAATTNVLADFSEGMRSGSITTGTFTLRKAGTTQSLRATVTYTASTKRAVLNPSANLQPGASYIATVTSGARDVAGNQLDQDPAAAGQQAKIWTFSVRR